LAWIAQRRGAVNLGVRRLGFGSGMPQIVWNHTERLAKEFLEPGNSNSMSKDYMAHSKLQGLFSQKTQAGGSQ
jgi:hypothetical protein